MPGTVRQLCLKGWNKVVIDMKSLQHSCMKMTALNLLAKKEPEHGDGWFADPAGLMQCVFCALAVDSLIGLKPNA